MKKILVLICAAVLSLGAWADDDSRQPIEAKKLPNMTLNILKSYYPDAQVVTATREKSKIKHNYEVTLDNGVDLTFDKDGQWTRVDAHGEAIPTRMVPGKIAMYLSKSEPGAVVTRMEKDNLNNYEIELTSGVIYLFDKQFVYIGTK